MLGRVGYAFIGLGFAFLIVSKLQLGAEGVKTLREPATTLVTSGLYRCRMCLSSLACVSDLVCLIG